MKQFFSHALAFFVPRKNPSFFPFLGIFLSPFIFIFLVTQHLPDLIRYHYWGSWTLGFLFSFFFSLYLFSFSDTFFRSREGKKEWGWWIFTSFSVFSWILYGLLIFVSYKEMLCDRTSAMNLCGIVGGLLLMIFMVGVLFVCLISLLVYVFNYKKERFLMPSKQNFFTFSNTIFFAFFFSILGHYVFQDAVFFIGECLIFFLFFPFFVLKIPFLKIIFSFFSGHQWIFLLGVQIFTSLFLILMDIPSPVDVHQILNIIPSFAFSVLGFDFLGFIISLFFLKKISFNTLKIF